MRTSAPAGMKRRPFLARPSSAPANLLIKPHGDEAPIHASMRAEVNASLEQLPHALRGAIVKEFAAPLPVVREATH